MYKIEIFTQERGNTPETFECEDYSHGDRVLTLSGVSAWGGTPRKMSTIIVPLLQITIVEATPLV